MYNVKNAGFFEPYGGWSPKNTPVYRRPRKDLLLVGVVHYNPEDRHPAGKMREFRRKLCKTEHLLLEGTEDAGRYMARIGKGAYETVAFTEHKETKHFLDEKDTDHVLLLGRQGMQTNTFGTFFMLPAISASIGDLQGTCARVRKYFDAAKSAYGPEHGLERIDTDVMVRAGPQLLVDLAFALFDEGGIDAAYLAFESFQARVRDAEIYGPRIAAICDGFPGMKAAVLGVSHVEPLAHVLKGGTLELDWNAHVESLDDTVKECVRRIERFSRGHLESFSRKRSF